MVKVQPAPLAAKKVEERPLLVDKKEAKEDNNMDVLYVQTFHNGKFWREC